MKIWVGVTDEQWFNQLSLLKPDEVNFWQPSGGRKFAALAPSLPPLGTLKIAAEISAEPTTWNKEDELPGNPARWLVENLSTSKHG